MCDLEEIQDKIDLDPSKMGGLITASAVIANIDILENFLDPDVLKDVGALLEGCDDD